MSKKKDVTLILDIFYDTFRFCKILTNYRKKIIKKIRFYPSFSQKSNYRVKINIIESCGSPVFWEFSGRLLSTFDLV